MPHLEGLSETYGVVPACFPSRVWRFGQRFAIRDSSEGTCGRNLVQRERCLAVDDATISRLDYCGELSTDSLEVIALRPGGNGESAVVAGVINRPGVPVVGQLLTGEEVLTRVAPNGSFVLEADQGEFGVVPIGPDENGLRCELQLSLSPCSPSKLP